MGQFAIVISGVGGHGCERSAKDGDHVLGCQRPDCPDCIAREFVRRLRRNGVSELRGEIVHWPSDPEALHATNIPEVATEGAVPRPRQVARYALVYPQATSVVDDLVTGVRTGSF